MRICCNLWNEELLLRPQVSNWVLSGLFTTCPVYMTCSDSTVSSHCTLVSTVFLLQINIMARGKEKPTDTLSPFPSCNNLQMPPTNFCKCKYTFVLTKIGCKGIYPLHDQDSVMKQRKWLKEAQSKERQTLAWGRNPSVGVLCVHLDVCHIRLRACLCVDIVRCALMQMLQYRDKGARGRDGDELQPNNQGITRANKCILRCQMLCPFKCDPTYLCWRQWEALRIPSWVYLCPTMPGMTS